MAANWILKILIPYYKYSVYITSEVISNIGGLNFHIKKLGQLFLSSIPFPLVKTNKKNQQKTIKQTQLNL